MKVLIVEDQFNKRMTIINILNELGIKYETENCVNLVLQNIETMNVNFIITDLGLPRFSNGSIQDEREGIKMLYDLSYNKIKIPTVIFSKTTLYENQIEYLKEIGYPYLGQATNEEELKNMLKNIFYSSDKIISKEKKYIKKIQTKDIIINLIKYKCSDTLTTYEYLDFIEYVLKELELKKILDKYEIAFDVDIESIKRVLEYNSDLFIDDIRYSNEIRIRFPEKLSDYFERYYIDENIDGIIKNYYETKKNEGNSNKKISRNNNSCLHK